MRKMVCRRAVLHQLLTFTFSPVYVRSAMCPCGRYPITLTDTIFLEHLTVTHTCHMIQVQIVYLHLLYSCYFFIGSFQGCSSWMAKEHGGIIINVHAQIPCIILFCTTLLFTDSFDCLSVCAQKGLFLLLSKISFITFQIVKTTVLAYLVAFAYYQPVSVIVCVLHMTCNSGNTHQPTIIVPYSHSLVPSCEREVCMLQTSSLFQCEIVPKKITRSNGILLLLYEVDTIGTPLLSFPSIAPPFVLLPECLGMRLSHMQVNCLLFNPISHTHTHTHTHTHVKYKHGCHTALFHCTCLYAKENL